MKNISNQIWIAFFLLAIVSCKKSAFLDKKPSTDINQPKTLSDFQQLLDNTQIMGYTGALAQASADENEISDANYQISTATERNAYIWAKNLYAGDVAIQDWNALYQQVFYSNVVLEGLAKSDSAATQKGKNLKGWALFSRAFALYDLTRNFCRPYEPGSANTDLGIPLRVSSAIDYLQQRSTLQQSFDKILSDLNESLLLLPESRQPTNLNRPSKVAAYALLARIYLDMRDYTKAENNAAQCLNLYPVLIDYNTVSKTSATPFSTTNDELILNTAQVPYYGHLTGNYSSSTAKVSANLISQYTASDLRLNIYFATATSGGYYKKRGYFGSGLYPFTGLATDEVYLIKAECLARKGETDAALDVLNNLVIKRLDHNVTYISITASSSSEALSKILAERRKELVWRGLRWQDLKRLNKEGYNITLSHTVNGVTYSLPPNDPRYVFPIPDDEIALSGIQQNIR